MAKTAALPPKIIKRASIEDNVCLKDAKKIKTGGEEYVTKQDWVMPGQMGTLGAGGKFVECMDGFYQGVSKSGKDAWFRVGKKIVDDLKEKDLVTSE